MTVDKLTAWSTCQLSGKSIIKTSYVPSSLGQALLGVICYVIYVFAIFLIAVAFLISMLLFQGYVACRNLTPTGLP